MNTRQKKKYVRKYLRIEKGKKFDWHAPIICTINTYGCGANIFNPTIKQWYRHMVELRMLMNWVKRVARNLDIYKDKRLKVKEEFLYPKEPQRLYHHYHMIDQSMYTGFVPGEIAIGHRLTPVESDLLAAPDHYYEYNEHLVVEPLNERAKKAVMNYEQETKEKTDESVSEATR